MNSLKNTFNELEPFFQQVDQIKKEYILNLKKESSEFNIFKLLKMQNKEVATHNRFIGELLDPNGSHNMGDSFQKIFLELVLPQQATHSWNVHIEERFDLCKFDISLQCENKRIVIESKIDSREGFQQLQRYHDSLSKNKVIDEFCILFLTIKGYTPRSISRKLASKIKPISYINDIAKWISDCIDITSNVNLKEILLQYKDLLISISNQELETLFMKRISDYCLKNNLVDLAIDVAEAANYIKFEIQKQFWMNLENYLEKKGLIVLNDNEKDDLSYVYDDEKIMKYYFNQKNNKHYGIPILLQKFESGEEAILMIKLENTLYFSILVAKKGKYLSFDKYKSKIPFEKKLNTFSHNWQSSSTGPAWYWKHPSIHSIPMNFKTFEQKEIRDLSDPKKLNVFVNKLGDEVFDLVQRFKRARN